MFNQHDGIRVEMGRRFGYYQKYHHGFERIRKDLKKRRVRFDTSEIYNSRNGRGRGMNFLSEINVSS